MMERGPWVVGCFVFGALGQLDALACMTEYAQARPTFQPPQRPPDSVRVAAPKWEEKRREG